MDGRERTERTGDGEYVTKLGTEKEALEIQCHPNINPDTPGAASSRSIHTPTSVISPLSNVEMRSYGSPSPSRPTSAQFHSDIDLMTQGDRGNSLDVLDALEKLGKTWRVHGAQRRESWSMFKKSSSCEDFFSSSTVRLAGLLCCVVVATSLCIIIFPAMAISTVTRFGKCSLFLYPMNTDPDEDEQKELELSELSERIHLNPHPYHPALPKNCHTVNFETRDGRNRHFENALQDYCGQNMTELIEALRPCFLEAIERNVALIEEKNLTRTSESPNIEGGLSGVALLYLHLSDNARNEVARNRFLIKSADFAVAAVSFVEENKPRVQSSGFLSGDPGILSVAAAVFSRIGWVEKAKRYRDMLIDRKEEALQGVAQLYYGTAGYLYACHFLNTKVERLAGEATRPVPVDTIFSIVQSILEAGKKEAAFGSSLLWTSHGVNYIGAGQGLTGILHTLMFYPEHLTHMGSQNSIKEALDLILSTKFDSGNYPSTLGSDTIDLLVQWDHGAPGLVSLFLQANHMFNQREYLDAAIDASHVVWDRGLLRKGNGLFHGTAGNAYAFLQLYQHTGRDIYLYRAIQFARFTLTKAAECTETLEEEDALFLARGITGETFLYTDIINPDHAFFPGYTV